MIKVSQTSIIFTNRGNRGFLFMVRTGTSGKTSGMEMGATLVGGATRSTPISSLASPSTSSVSSSRSPPSDDEQYRRSTPKRICLRQRPRKGDLPSQVVRARVTLCLLSG